MQSFAPEHETPTDAEILGEATLEDPHTVCPAHRWLPRDGSADGGRGAGFRFVHHRRPGRRSDPNRTARRDRVGGERGRRSFTARSDGDTVALVAALQPALVVLVADAELGTINLVQLSIDALRGHRVVVYLNRYDQDDELHVRNHDWLTTRVGLGLDVVADPDALEEIVAALPH